MPAPNSIVKVLAAGATPSGQLRVTVMFSPICSTSGSELVNWPSSMLAAMRACHWRVNLKVALLRVTPGGSPCVSTYDAAIEAAKTVPASATWAGQVWGERPTPGWLDSLWQRGFRMNGGRADALDPVWSSLAGTLRRSNAGKALQAGALATGASRPPERDKDGTKPPAPVGKPLPDGAPSVTVNAVVPSRQSDLAVLFETQRAFELCATARWAHDGVVACAAEEIACAEKARAVRDPDTLKDSKSAEGLDALWAETSERFRYAKAVAESHYKAVCGEPGPIGSGKPWVIDPNQAAGNDRLDNEHKIPAPLNSHEVANQPEDSSNCATSAEFLAAQADAEKLSSQRFFAVQGSPALSRLFGLTFDLAIELEDLARVGVLSTGQLATSDMTAHVLIGFGDMSPPGPPAETTQQPESLKVWTIAKLKPAQEATRTHFWPASRIELAMQPGADAHKDLSQYDGVIVLGQSLPTAALKDGGVAGPTVNRFMLTSLDVPAASEAAIDRRRRSAATQQASTPAAVATLARRPIDWSRKTLSTAGLVLLDRGRLEQAVHQFAARTVNLPRTGYVVLDANDLTIGYRLDVAIPVLTPAERHHASAKGVAAVRDHRSVNAASAMTATMKWHTLMARQIVHGTDRTYGNEVSQATSGLMASSGSAKHSPEWQETLDDAVLALPVRMVVTDDSNPNSPKADAFIEEAVAIWTGEPMAAHCSGPSDSKVTASPVGAGDLIKLPDSRSTPGRRPPPLRFGWSYRCGVRAVYAGGISLSLSHAAARYDGSSTDLPGNKLTLPPFPADRPQGVRRFLRHERIDAPSLLMHGELALRANGEMGFERGPHAILRSSEKGKYSLRGAPTSTTRIFVPPSVDIHFAALHGVFDNFKGPKPPEGLHNVRYDAPGGGFPFVTTRAGPIAGINDEAFDRARFISNAKGQRGDTVYVQGGGSRPVPYFPDPAIDAYAIGVRYAGTDIYLRGKPFTVDVYAADDYPNCRPLVLRIERAVGRKLRDPNPRLDEVLSHGHVGTAPPVHHGAEVTVTLAPGDDFEIDVWCIPSAKRLAKVFAMVESIGVMALARTRVRVDLQASPQEQRLSKALRQLLPDRLCDGIERCIGDFGGWPDLSKPEASEGHDGVGGLTAPSRKVLLAIATAVYDTLASRPLDEIAAVQTLRATHATLRPLRMPEFESFGTPRALQACRTSASLEARTYEVSPAGSAASSPSAASAARAASTAFAPGASTSPAPGSPGSSPAALPPPQPTHEYHLVGDLNIDLMTTGAFELRARVAFPTVAAFDDRYRGRSTRDRRNGTWPHQGKDLTTEEVFGFCVDPDGTVTLPRSEVTLLRVEDLPPPLPGGLPIDAKNRASVRLEMLTLGEGVTSVGTVKSRHIFPDRKARRLDIRVLARPRHETLMRTASDVARDGRWLRSGKDAIDPADDARPPVSVWLPADVRPAEPVAHTPIPAFVWQTLPNGARSRVAVIRISLGRGWYSSGEDERLGIVVWPPNLFELVPEYLAKDQIATDGYPERQMNLSDFMDEDLGAGGRFVTRWGSDPTKPADEFPRCTPLRTFVEPLAFGDLAQQTRLGFEAGTAEFVDMPVRTGAKTAADRDKHQADSTLKVSLVTYVPRFDIETEQWYVNVALRHPYEAQPFLRLGLVRYQAHASADRQVSFPVSQWVQLLPQRQVRVTNGSAQSGRTALVIVEGIGASTATVDAIENKIGTKMWLSVIREYTSDAGLRCRQVVRTDVMGSKLTRPGIGGEYHGPLTTWTAPVDLDLIKSKLDERQKAAYFAYVEERENYLPASYVNEPVSADVAKGIAGQELKAIEGGPRFSARIALQPA